MCLWQEPVRRRVRRSLQGVLKGSSVPIIVGDASFCIDAIERYRALGIKEIACLMNFGGPGPDSVERSMRLFGEKIMPRVSA
jgi:alkanesulfonate monooxygenase SsuD/methylene tetrahydromethanopterin reductase-like flavin-dependent oxidoreductase (luciferase family)